MDAVEKSYIHPDAQHVRIFNAWEPALQSGRYKITAQQTIKTASERPVETSHEQQFVIPNTPFVLDTSLISSYYPASNELEHGSTLPHIVFNDPHLTSSRTLALLVFEREDLFPHDPEELKAYASVQAEQLSDGSFSMRAEQYQKLAPKYDDEIFKQQDPRGLIRIIAPRHSTLLELLGSTDDLHLLRHVRMVNTANLPINDRKFATFSVLISANHGSLEPEAREMIAHVVSLDGLSTSSLNSEVTDRIGLCSLFSWAYKSDLQSKSLSGLFDLVKSADSYHRVSMASSLVGQRSSVEEALRKRIAAGYGLCPWRTPTGERFTCLLRGPLTPGPVPAVPVKEHVTTIASDTSIWPDYSVNGEDLQMVDADTLLPDLTYSAAWQLGRTQAIADKSFAASLHRLRSSMARNADSQVRMNANSLPIVSAVAASLPAALEKVTRLSKFHSARPERLASLSQEAVLTSLAVPSLTWEHRAITLKHFAGISPDSLTSQSDLLVVFRFLVDRLNLLEIPVHYLLPNTSLCPLESLRLFHVDDAYLDCVIDGALSVANHSIDALDTPRRAIKEAFNQYLSKDMPLPRAVCIINSTVLQSIPDLKISVRCKMVVDGKLTLTEDPLKDPVLKYDRTQDGSLRILLACLPTELLKMTFSPPAHQQHYAIPLENADSTRGKIALRALPGKRQVAIPLVELAQIKTAGSRTIRLPELQEMIKKLLGEANVDAGVVAYQLTAHSIRPELRFDGSQGQLAPLKQARQIRLLPSEPIQSSSETENVPVTTTEPSIPTNVVPAPQSSQKLPEIRASAIAVPSTRRIPQLPSILTELPPSGRESVSPAFELTVSPNWIHKSVTQSDNGRRVNTYTFEPVFNIRRLTKGKAAISFPADCKLHSFDVLIPSYPNPRVMNVGNDGPIELNAFMDSSEFERHDARMLRNIRFVPQMSYSGQWTRVRLLPRGSAGDFATEQEGEQRLPTRIALDLAATSEASFKLGRRTITDTVDLLHHQSVITLVERYQETMSVNVGYDTRHFKYAISSTTVDRSPSVEINKDMYLSSSDF